MNLGWTELLLIGGILLLLFGPSKLPGLGKSIGEAIRGFKKGLSEIDTDLDQDKKTTDQRIVSGTAEKIESQNAAEKVNSEVKEKNHHS